ncbi:MAG: hypothetical protein C0594_05555 [Marinilabiliales bacterium]|nr:MAG: hypothetical protein C0594_05555 [Marinilabiliales bacterium]
MTTVHKYNLPDFDIFNNDQANKNYSFWIPDKKYLILGQSNKPEDSLFEEKVNEDNLTVYKRPSGGEAVILTKNTLVISIVFTAENFENPGKYFSIANGFIMNALRKLGISNIGQKGISDITIGNKKILGSSIYRRKDKIFYHAVLNVSESISQIAYYLKHPKKEPDYRKGRNHQEFVTSIRAEGFTFEIHEIISAIENEIISNNHN